MEEERTLLTIKSDKQGLMCECRVPDFFSAIEVVRMLNDVRDGLSKQIDTTLSEFKLRTDIPEEVRKLLEHREINKPIIDIVNKIQNFKT